ncbi:hypothetical protein SAMD00019534_121280 [Acytostelium subglobosum LB1]|uniref:hypothetical protein n=1 Tax=Acytostelium subglobosum LB1 TaxID=1410327 RepID=UPI0006448715|nr:hypothetical protein SAMD00019534_121280 [Acytostelium subglobosum LB1]GAM28952.1 hypothetical protein SAMD00019534_121280 [Acytostelium subglobosum LB1]|eukprot:XP_012748137.1 hypothetical protein SAMD00019534_121280 [Acytostelium subglobosum LB1]
MTMIIDLSNNNITSVPDLPVSTTSRLSYLYFSNNKYLTKLPDFTCTVWLVRMDGTSINQVPDCYSCYISAIKPFFNPPATLKIPANYSCDVYIDQVALVATKSQPMLTITGNNLGGAPLNNNDFDPRLKPVVPNKITTFNPPFPSGVANITFSYSKNIVRLISWTTLRYYSVNLNKLELVAMGTFNRTQVYTVTVDNTHSCIVKNVTTTSITCDVQSINLTQETPVLVEISIPNAAFNKSIIVNYYPVVTSVPPIMANQTTIIIYGGFTSVNTTAQEVSVIVGNQSCNLFIYTTSMIVCKVNNTLDPGPVHLSINVSGSVYTSSGDLVVQPLEIVKQCGNDSNCSGNGQCVEGKCSCLPNYGGFICDLPINPDVIIVPDPAVPTSIISSNVSKFDISVVSIQEVDQIGSVVKELLTPSWNKMEPVVDGTLTTNQYTLINVAYLDVTVLLQTSAAPLVMKFAGVNMTLDTNTLKQSINVNGWRYRSNLNTLRIVIKVDSEFKNQDQTCIPSLNSNGTDPFDPNNIQFIKQHYDGMTFFGSFLPVGLSDGRPFHSLTQLITTNSSTTMIGINMPQCNQCSIDPNFSILLDGDSSEGTPRNKSLCATRAATKKFDSWKIATIVVVCGLAIIAVVATTVVVIRQRSKYRVEQRRIDSKLKVMQQQQQH